MEYQEIAKMIGANIKLHRAKTKLTQDKLALKSGIHKATLSRIEDGKLNITLRTLNKLCDALEIKPIEIMGENVIQH